MSSKGVATDESVDQPRRRFLTMSTTVVGAAGNRCIAYSTSHLDVTQCQSESGRGASGSGHQQA